MKGGWGKAMHNIIDLLPALQWKAASSSPLPSQTPFVSSSPTTTSNPNFPVSVINNTDSAACGINTSAMKTCVGGKKQVTTSTCNSGPCFYAIFGTVPSPFEVENAVAALINFIEGIWPSGSELNRFGQMLNVGSLLSNGYRRLLDALRLLQTDASIKRLVLSLSSDKAVWDAIMNNEMVQKLQQQPSHHSVRLYSLPSCEEEPNAIAPTLKWITDLIKTKICELIQNFQKLLDELLQPRPLDCNDKGASKKEAVDERLESSVLLVVVILLVVILARVKCA